MTKKNTGELLQLMKNRMEYSEYLKDNGDELIFDEGGRLPMALDRLLKQKKMRRAQVIADANMAESTGYQIFSGKRGASRDKVIALSFGFHLDLEETQQFLAAAGYGALYARNARDNAIIYAIQNRYGIVQLELLLESYGFPQLGNSE